MGSPHVRAEVVRGQADERRREQVLALWDRHGVLVGEAARARLDDLVCVLVDEQEDVVGVSSAYVDRPPHLGGRPFWVHRRFLAPGVPAEAEVVLVNEAFAALEAEAVAAEGGAPVGLCVLVDDPATLARRPEAVWADCDLRYAGYVDGAQVRVRYFDGARIA